MGYVVSMSRVVLTVAVVLLSSTPVAGAATVGVYDDPRATAVALAGPDAVVLRQVGGAPSQLVAVPRGGGKPQTVLTVPGMHHVFETRSDGWPRRAHAWR